MARGFLLQSGRIMMTAKYTNLEQTRLEKLERLRAQGIEPYPTRSERTHTSLEAVRVFEEAEAAAETPATGGFSLVGRLRSMRPMGKVTFAT
jgi:lysyl-tRNA synthetase class 2